MLLYEKRNLKTAFRNYQRYLKNRCRRFVFTGLGITIKVALSKIIIKIWATFSCTNSLEHVSPQAAGARLYPLGRTLGPVTGI